MWLWPLSKGSKGTNLKIVLAVTGEVCYLSP